MSISNFLNITNWKTYKLVNSVSILNSEEGIRRIVVSNYPEFASSDISAAVKDIYRIRRSLFFKHIDGIISILSFLIDFTIFILLSDSSDKTSSDLFAILFIILFLVLYFILNLIFGPSHDDYKIKENPKNERKKWYNRELFSKKQPYDNDTD